MATGNIASKSVPRLTRFMYSIQPALKSMDFLAAIGDAD